MSRYLTPAKIAILELSLLYAEDVVPTSQAKSVLAFILAQILPPDKSAGHDFEPATPISAFESTLSGQPSARPGRSLYDLLLKKLWAIDCSDALESFITNLPQLLTKPREQILRERETGEVSDQTYGRILRTSPLGLFIRRCHLEYERLQFQDSITLWQDFIVYRAPTRQAHEKKNPPLGRSAIDGNFEELQIDGSHPLAQIMYGRLAEIAQDPDSTYSPHEVEKLMEFQVSEMQRLGGRLPDEMKSRLEQMSKTGRAMPKLGHYLAFLDSWRAGDYFSAFDNLHRYFDYTMQTRERTFYQYALLNLAILQADFGCHAEALPAMQEAIATARETKDTTCLNFCMSWLYHFGRNFPAQMKKIRESGILGSETEGLAFLKSRARDAEMWNLLSTSMLTEAKLGLQSGDSLAGVFESIAKASHIDIVKSANGTDGSALLFRGATYSRIGLSHMAWLSAQTFLQCHAKEASLDDLLKYSCRTAGILVHRGRYDEAEELLNNLPPEIHRVLKSHNHLTSYTGLLKVRRLLHRGDLDAAELLLQRLKGQGRSDVEMGFSLSMLEIDLLHRRGILDRALESTETLAQRATAEINDVIVQIRLMNLKVRLLADSDNTLKGFSLATQAAQIAYRARTLPLLWESLGLLANILNTLREFSAAAELMHAIMPQVLETKDCDLAAHSYSFLVDANMGLANLEQDQSTKQKEFISHAVEHLDQALLQFRYIEDLRGQLEMLKKKATVMHWQGDLVLANDTASQFIQLERQYNEMRL
ncbi:hypothetical protein LTR84_005212 [Exophiala bonariae]|uniref:Anaphase-promoting complex subunit 5 n=1 Tax=Exophiala bonariae TaxID=1690606 RepID=A0AAV9NQU7_9EURO|nr:hypothetical protein LTR84_005212 [Exophiala bonariae]